MLNREVFEKVPLAVAYDLLKNVDRDFFRMNIAMPTIYLRCLKQ